LIFFLLLLPLFNTAEANSEKGLENLSLNEALDLMKQDNLELKVSKFTEQIQEYEAMVAKAPLLGNLM